MAGKVLAHLMAWLKSRAWFREFYASLLYERVNQGFFASVDEQEKMLADGVRFGAYARAIAKHVGKGDVVVDVGTGTGLLAFLAAQQGPRKVYAIDHSAIIQTAEYIAKHNGIHCIEFLNQHSKSFAPPERANVIVHEQIGSALFNENMVETIVDLRDRVLAQGGRVLPARFDLYVEPVQLKDEYRVPFVWEHKVGAVDYGCVREHMREKAQVEKPLRMIQNVDVAFLLSEPEPLYKCDLGAMRKEDLPSEFHSRRIVRRSGRLDGFCLYFTARFDEELSFSTFPHCPRTHWSTPLFRVEPRQLEAGATLQLQLKFGDVRDLSTWKVTLDGG